MDTAPDHETAMAGAGIEQHAAGRPPALPAADPYRQLVQQAGHLLWTLTPDGVIDAEQGWRPFTGQSPAEAQGWGWLAAIHPDDRERVRQEWTQVLAGQGRYESVYRLRCADGAYRTLLVRAMPVTDPVGHMRSWAAFGTDVTAHEEVTAALRASEEARQVHEERLRTVVANAPIVLFAVDRDGVFTLSQGRGLQTLGIAPDAHVGHSYFTLYGDLPESIATMRRVLAGEAATTVEHFRGLVFETRWMPTLAADGTVTGVIGVSADITARARAEEERDALLQREQQVRAQALAALLEMAQTVVQAPAETEGLSDHATRVVGQRLVALARQVLGCERIGLVALDQGSGVQRALAVIGLSPQQEQEWWTLVDGQPLVDPLSPADPAFMDRFLAGEAMVLDLTQPPYRDQPNPFGVRSLLLAPLCVGADVVGLLTYDYGGADHTYTAEELAVAAGVAQFAALTIERERLLREREEARASTLALRAANQRMDEFLGVASHELRTPLTGLRGSLQLMQRRLEHTVGAGGDDLSAAELAAALSRLSPFLDRALHQSRVLAGLVDDLLDLSRIRAGQLQLRLVPCDVVALVGQTVEERRALEPTRIITLELPRQTVLVAADAARLAQVVDHYLDNALKYSTVDQPVTVRVAVDGAMVRVWVRDMGPGILPAEQKRIWERFYQPAGIEHRSGSSVGLGLGLYLSRTIIERHGGRVGVESTAGAGAGFWFSLPRVATE